MIGPAPTYTFRPRYSLTLWYGHVHLLPDHLLGQWFCIDRKTGKPLWEHRYFRPNTVDGVSDGVIVASETRSDGPWTAGFGCYGLSLDTGELLWTSHRNGLSGSRLRLLDFVPGFTNDLRDIPIRVVGNECMCRSGRVLDVRNGRQVRQLSKDHHGKITLDKSKSDAQLLFDGQAINSFTRVPFTDGKWLSHKRTSDDASKGFQLHLLADDGAVLWTFNIGATSYHMSYHNFYSYHYCPPYVYVVASEDPNFVPHRTKAHYIVPNPTVFHLLTLDLGEGRIKQDQRISEQKFDECRIEDTDERGIIISAGRRVTAITRDRQLFYYERTSG